MTEYVCVWPNTTCFGSPLFCPLPTHEVVPESDNTWLLGFGLNFSLVKFSVHCACNDFY